MALAVDAASPARATATTGAATTAAFNPPVGVLIACAGLDNTGADTVTRPTLSMSNNGAALTWTHFILRNKDDVGGIDGGVAAAWTYLSGARTGMTVTFTNTLGSRNISGKLYVVTGADTSSPIGGSAEGSQSASNVITTTAYTTAGDSSLGFVVSNDWNALGAPASTGATVDTYHVAGAISGMAGYKVTGTAGSSATFEIDSGGSGGPALNWVTFEVEAPGAATAAPRPFIVNQAALVRAHNW